jgi:hypothetical protein
LSALIGTYIVYYIPLRANYERNSAEQRGKKRNRTDGVELNEYSKTERIREIRVEHFANQRNRAIGVEWNTAEQRKSDKNIAEQNGKHRNRADGVVWNKAEQRA